MYESFIFLLSSQQLSLLFLLFSHDSPVSEQPVFSTSFSCSLLEETPSSLTKWAEFCFWHFLLRIGVTDTSTGWFLGSAVVPDTGVRVAPVPLVLLSDLEVFSYPWGNWMYWTELIRPGPGPSTLQRFLSLYNCQGDSILFPNTFLISQDSALA